MGYGAGYGGGPYHGGGGGGARNVQRAPIYIYIYIYTVIEMYLYKQDVYQSMCKMVTCLIFSWNKTTGFMGKYQPLSLSRCRYDHDAVSGGALESPQVHYRPYPPARNGKRHLSLTEKARLKNNARIHGGYNQPLQCGVDKKSEFRSYAQETH